MLNEVGQLLLPFVKAARHLHLQHSSSFGSDAHIVYVGLGSDLLWSQCTAGKILVVFPLNYLINSSSYANNSLALTCSYKLSSTMEM